MIMVFNTTPVVQNAYSTWPSVSLFCLALALC